MRSREVPWQPLIATLIALMMSSAIFVVGYLRDSKETDSQVAAWELTVSQLYGKQIHDFSPLGEEGLHFEWVDPEDSDLLCTQSQSCNIIRLANVISCQHGFKVSYEFLGQKDEVLSKHLSSTVFVPVGHFKVLEIDTETLPDSGWLSLTGAKCQTTFPSE